MKFSVDKKSIGKTNWELVTFATMVLIACTPTPGMASGEVAAIKITPVTIVKAVEINMVSQTNVRGEIESPGTPRIAAKVSAEVVSMHVEEGMHVNVGQLLAELDDEAFKIAEEKSFSNVQRMQALIENQLRIIERNRELMDKKMISQSVVDSAITAQKQFEAELSNAKAKQKEAHYLLSHTQIVSPIDGIVQRRMVSKGDYVKVGDFLFHIISTDQLRARVYFPDSLANSIHVGMKVKLTKGREFVNGEISSLRPMLEDGSRALHALVDFDNQTNWKPGTSITAIVTLEVRAKALAIPERALVRRPAGLVAYRVQNEKVIEQVVTTGMKKGELIEVKTGLTVDDSVVLDGAAWLTDGTTVDIQESY